MIMLSPAVTLCAATTHEVINRDLKTIGKNICVRGEKRGQELT